MCVRAHMHVYIRNYRHLRSGGNIVLTFPYTPYQPHAVCLKASVVIRLYVNGKVHEFFVLCMLQCDLI